MDNLRQPYGPIDDTALTQFEQQLPGPIPDDLKQFLRESNGASFSGVYDPEKEEDGESARFELGQVFGLHSGPMYQRLDWIALQLKGRIPESILIFGADPYDNYFGISLTGADAGTVYFVDHETLPADRDSFLPVCASFSDLLRLAEVRFIDRIPATTLLDAVRKGDTEALARFLAVGHDTRGAVHRAVHAGDLRVLEMLLRHGADPNERGGIGDTETPLFVAARNNRADMADSLIHHGADPNLRCSAGGTALQMAKPWPEVVAVLKRGGARS